MKANMLIQGLIGSGKTTCLQTLVKAELEPFIVSMEPGIEATLYDYICPQGPMHWHYIPPGADDWSTVRKFAVLSTTLDTEKLSHQQDPNRSRYTQLLDLFSVCANFRCHGCREEFGDVAQFDEERALALDGLTGLTNAARRTICGSSPFLSLPKIGHIQGLIESFLDLWWGGTKCTAILLAHLEREVSPLTGLPTTTLSTMGQRLAPKILNKPDEIITAERSDRGRYVWNTVPTITQPSKRRRLPESADLEPDFSQLFKT